MDGEEDDVGWHWDADYEARDRGDVKHPFLATVTYLEAGGSVAPTAIVEACREESIMACNGAVIHSAHLSLPVPGKHICFDGTLLHGAPVELRNVFGSCVPRTGKKRSARSTLLVNIWRGHRPRDPQRLPSEVAAKLGPVTVASPFTLGSQRAAASCELVVGRGVSAQEMSWSFGESDGLSVAFPVPLEAAEASDADTIRLHFTDGRCGCVGWKCGSQRIWLSQPRVESSWIILNHLESSWIILNLWRSKMCVDIFDMWRKITWISSVRIVRSETLSAHFPGWAHLGDQICLDAQPHQGDLDRVGDVDPLALNGITIITISYLQHITAFCILKVISCNFSTGGRNKGRYPSLMTQNIAGEKGEKGTDMNGHDKVLVYSFVFQSLDGKTTKAWCCTYISSYGSPAVKSCQVSIVCSTHHRQSPIPQIPMSSCGPCDELCRFKSLFICWLFWDFPSVQACRHRASKLKVTIDTGGRWVFMAMYNCKLRSCREVMSCLFAAHVAFLVESLELRVIAWLLGVLPNSWEVGKLSMIPLCHMSPKSPFAASAIWPVRQALVRWSKYFQVRYPLFWDV